MAEIQSFLGVASPSHFSGQGLAVSYSGPAGWGYRRMVLHYARLCALAGGVDAFLIGSELRGLTTLRRAGHSFPFVEALVTLAAEVKAILPGARISYGADWTEYSGHRPEDGSGDVFFHLDPLWSSPAVDFVGIDNYMPLSDWRDEPQHVDQVAGFGSIYDPAPPRHATRRRSGWARMCCSAGSGAAVWTAMSGKGAMCRWARKAKPIASILQGFLLRRSVTVAAPQFLYTAEQMLADYPVRPLRVVLRIQQISTAYGPGAPFERILDV